MSWLESDHLVYLAALAIAFASVVSLVLGARYLLGGRSSAVRARLARYTAAPAIAGVTQPAANGEAGAVLRATLAPLARLATPSTEEELGRVRARLAQGGYRGERALGVYFTVRALLSVALGALALWLLSLVTLPLLAVALITIAAVALGFYAPSLYLASRVTARQAELEHSLPGALDLLVTTVEAGLGLDAAMDRVAAEIGLSAPLLSAELKQTALEMAAGLGRGEAFRRMADRTGVDELRMLAAIIVQTELFGTSVAHSLRIQSASMRLRRTQRAEERAASVGVKMTVPLIFCIVPALFVVLIGPGVVRILRHLLPALAGGG